MRHLVAWLLLVLAGFPPITAAVLRMATGQPDMPACCRRDGKHGCGMNKTPASGLAFGKAVCGQYPRGAGSVAQPDWAFAPVLSGAVTATPGVAAMAAQMEIRRRISLGRGWQKRGPPSNA